MRTSLFLAFFSGFSLLAQDFAPTLDTSTPNKTPRLEVEIIDMCGCGQETHYAGGIIALRDFINENITFPVDMKWGNINHAKTYVQFIVEKDGSLSDVHVIGTNFPEANQYILAAFDKMTNWIAGEYKCRAERTRLRIPISLIIK